MCLGLHFFFFFWFTNTHFFDEILFKFNDFADRNSTKPKLSLINKESLNRILQAEVYVNKADGQLWVAHLILGYTPLSLAFQAPKYVIKARDSQLHRISVAYQGFVVPEGIPIPEGTSRTQPLFVATPSIGASSSQLILEEGEEGKEEEEEEEEKGSEGIVNLTDSSNEFEVFNQPPSPESIPDEMGIQRKPQKSLMELIEDQPGRGAPGKSTQPKLPPPPPKSPLPPP